jgi:predicted AlkP superfamily phosphohydrolase/phosphomutase
MILRSLGSAALAGLLFALDLVVLVLFLNPGFSLGQNGLPVLGCLLLPYWGLGFLGLSVAALIGLLGRPARRPRPIVEGLPFFASLNFLALLVSAALFWFNLWSYRFSISHEFLRALALGSLVLSLAPLVLLAVGVDAQLFPRRSRGPGAAIAVLAVASAVVVPLALLPSPTWRLPAEPVALETVKPLRRVVLIGLDGLGPKQIREVIARGHAPELAQLLRRGAFGPLATLRPTEGPPLWTTVFTGLLPREHGVKSFARYRLGRSQAVLDVLPKGALVGLLEKAGLVSTTPLTSADRQRRALWTVLNAFGIDTGVVRFWGTYPPEPVNGFMLSNLFHLLAADPRRGPSTLHPPDLFPEVRAKLVTPADLDRARLSEFVDLSAEAPPEAASLDRRLLERALAPDLSYHRAGTVLRAAYDPPFFATSYFGLDVVGQAFMRYAKPDQFGDVRPQELRRYGAVLDRYTALLSRLVGEVARGPRPEGAGLTRPGEVVLLVSTYGMEPVPLRRRILEAALGSGTGSSGTHAGAPDGFILAVGDGIKAGAAVSGASILDVTPTVLYLMGLPVARDMEGRALTEMVDEDFAQANPLTFIPSYRSLAVAPPLAHPPFDLPPLPDEEP